MTYQEADQQLTGRNVMSRKIDNNTYLNRRGDDIAVTLHGTDVVTLHRQGGATYYTGGWQTVTTKDRMSRYGLTGWKVYQKKHEWFLVRFGESPRVWEDAAWHPFYQTATITRAGRVRKAA